MSARARSRPGRIFHLAALAGLAVLMALGTWQVRRLAWKEGLIASIDTRINGAPLSLADVERRFAETGDVDYVPVSLSGSLSAGNEQYFLATHEGQSGWNIYAPLQLADQRVVVLNRGFVPYDLRDPEKRPQTAIDGMVNLTGLARNPLSAKPSSIMPENDPVKNVWFWKDITSMAKATGVAPDKLLPFFVDDWTEQAQGALPVTRTTIISLPNNHLQYAITWYGLAAALAGVWAVMTLRRGAATHAA